MVLGVQIQDQGVKHSQILVSALPSSWRWLLLTVCSHDLHFVLPGRVSKLTAVSSDKGTNASLRVPPKAPPPNTILGVRASVYDWVEGAIQSTVTVL